MSPLDLVARAAMRLGAQASAQTDDSFLLHLEVLHSDGSRDRYQLRVQARGTHITAREETPALLPSFCPERHINPDGTFCLYFPEAQALDVTDEDSATAWAETLWTFLRLQRRAERLGRWPNNHTWAHGDAARYQLRATIAAASFGSPTQNRVAQGHLSVQHLRVKQRDVFRVMDGAVHLFSVWGQGPRLIGKRKPCWCGSKESKKAKRIGRCADHASQAAQMAIAIHRWAREEEDFWRRVGDKACCGRCSECRLQKQVPR
ncbi:hypothetical protein PV762_11675 [Mitsuaria sp. CC2]|uniref:E2 domain-containing protein n=1 Tax=Mitsuaria sp. CC2 TaxID=3029186 RepID=UPI003B8C20D5